MKDSVEIHVEKNASSNSSTKPASIPPLTGTTENETPTIRTEVRILKAETSPPVVEDVDPTKEKAVEYMTGMKLYLVLFGVGMVVFLMMLDQTIIVTTIPRITSEFNSTKDIGWYGSAYMLLMYVYFSLILQPPC